MSETPGQDDIDDGKPSAITVSESKYVENASEIEKSDSSQNNKPSESAELSHAASDDTSKGAIAKYESAMVKVADDSWWWCDNRPGWLNAVFLVFWCGCGFLEGYSFSETGFADPGIIVFGLKFEVWVLFRVFISAVGASFVAQGLMDLVFPEYFDASRPSRNLKKRPPLWRAIAGGFLTGVGLALGSSGPTLTPSQIGVNATSGWAVAVGLVAGGIVFAICDELFLSEYVCEVDAEERPMLAIDEWLGVRYFKLAIPAGVAMFAFACMLEFVIPGTSRFDDQPELTIGVLKWPAIVTGTIIGANQFFSRCLTNQNREFGGEGLGGTGSVMLVVSVASFGKLAPRFFPTDPDTGAFKFKPPLFQLVFLWVGTALGAFTSHTLNVQVGDSPSTVSGPEVWMAVVGGALAIFGSMMCLIGCVCGASVSSMSEGSALAIVVTVATFVGAIPTAWVVSAVRSA